MKNLLTILIFCVSFFSCDQLFTNTEGNDSNEKVLGVKEAKPSKISFKNYLQINAFEWDFVSDKAENIDERQFDAIKTFSGIRHYLNWDKIEPVEGKYSFSPNHAGGWDYDLIYSRLKEAGMDVLVDVKSCPPWLINTYPADKRNAENVPAPYGLDRSNPASYVKQGRMAFQLAARYGSNRKIQKNLVQIDTLPRWTGDRPNIAQIGMDLIKYIECDNERDKWWFGPQASQTAEEYAANMSAFYDGHKGKLGKNVGVKTGDPRMVVVMGGLSTPDVKFVLKMIAWCKKNRGFKSNGKVDLCFDVINYHIYSDNASENDGKSTVGVAPERSNIANIADQFLEMSRESAYNLPVWVTETGFDVGQTPERAIPIGKKSPFITQADWNLRTSLLYSRRGIAKSIFYMLKDVDINSTIQFTSSGFLNADFTRRPTADFILQARKVIGDYCYQRTISTSPFVDLYQLNNKQIYVLWNPTQKGLVTSYELNIGRIKQAKIHELQIGKSNTLKRIVNANNGKLKIEVSETPIFVELL